MNKRILVIDDEDGLREIIQFSLEVVAGWEVITASSGRSGIALAQSEQPDAILLDVMMPGMDGPSTFRELKSHATTEQIPTIWLTAKAQIREQKELIELGGAGAILKPFKAEDLAHDVRKILQWSE
ncbi:response regulator [Phormidium pseudopriestleyi FRX01]|uniref:Response regulator n=1 Tax=Phormidium pseudopriestleyi FRX01 TaxID=1759528 RepID=A0ABS3FS24_9CYAN|nr:response regulator [Phormidium pseudopriestleyi]MBO0349912.1 response regulator [Phormidium pseudopriestleyi FRX01]